MRFTLVLSVTTLCLALAALLLHFVRPGGLGGSQRDRIVATSRSQDAKAAYPAQGAPGEGATHGHRTGEVGTDAAPSREAGAPDTAVVPAKGVEPGSDRGPRLAQTLADVSVEAIVANRVGRGIPRPYNFEILGVTRRLEAVLAALGTIPRGLAEEFVEVGLDNIAGLSEADDEVVRAKQDAHRELKEHGIVSTVAVEACERKVREIIERTNGALCRLLASRLPASRTDAAGRAIAVVDE